MKQIYDCVCLGAMLVLIKPCDPTKSRRGRGYRNALALTLEDGTLSTLLSLLLLHISTFFASAASFLCCLHTCQAFIKQLEEGVSFPWSSCQLFPISPAPWKSLKTPLFLGLGLSLGLGLGLGYRLCVQGWGSLWRSSVAPQSIGLDSVLTSTDSYSKQHPQEPFGIALHVKPVSSPHFVISIENGKRHKVGKTKRRGRIQQSGWQGLLVG